MRKSKHKACRKNSRFRLNGKSFLTLPAMAIKPAKPACHLNPGHWQESTAAKLRVPLGAAPTWLNDENCGVFNCARRQEK
jgi:hypothetical protein